MWILHNNVDETSTAKFPLSKLQERSPLSFLVCVCGALCGPICYRQTFLQAEHCQRFTIFRPFFVVVCSLHDVPIYPSKILLLYIFMCWRFCVWSCLCVCVCVCVCVGWVHKWVHKKKHPWNKNDQEYIVSMTSIKIYLYDPACLPQVWKLLLPVFVLRFVQKLPHGCLRRWIRRKWVHTQWGRSHWERHYQWRSKQQLHQTAAAARDENNCKCRISTEPLEEDNLAWRLSLWCLAQCCCSTSESKWSSVGSCLLAWSYDRNGLWFFSFGAQEWIVAKN